MHAPAWLRPYLQPVTYLGVAMLLFVYAAIGYLLIQDRKNAETAAIRHNENLTLLFAQSIQRSFQSADNTIKLIRQLYRNDPSHIDLTKWTNDPELKNELVVRFSIIGKDGRVRHSSFGPSAIGLDVSQAQSFKVHAASAEDRLFISAPVQLPLSQEQGILMTRRLSAEDGTFEGVLSASFDISQLVNLYRNIKLGADGFASLWRLDGTILAAGANGQPRWDHIGKRFPNAGVFNWLPNSPVGSYWNTPNAPDRRLERIKRLISYRAVEGFPLIAIVANPEAEVFKNAAGNARAYWTTALLLTACILIAIAVGARRERKLTWATSSLAQTGVRFETALANMPHGLCMFDASHRLIISNPQYASMYGLTADQVKPGTPLSEIVASRVAHESPGPAQEYRRTQLALAAHPQPKDSATELPDGRVILVSHKPMADGGLVAVHQDITAQRQTEAQIWNLAHHDGLTGLANRTHFLQKAGEVAERCRQGDSRFAIHLLDLDNFKEVNDTLGHPVGDALLKEVARRLKGCLDETDLVARLGGDEFAILQTIKADAQREIAALSERLIAVVDAPIELECHEVFAETSIGIALAPEHGLDAEQLLKRADLALYRVKASGRHGYRVFEPSMEQESTSRRTLLLDLRASIAARDFEIHYQPIIRAADQTIIGAEALVRWRHPRDGMIGPDRFIPLAEDTGLINPLGEWILRTACAEAAGWPQHIKVAVNLSPAQFRKGNLVQTIQDALAESKLSPDRLEIEVTESVLLEHNESNISTLRELQRLGVAIVLDDFGTGYSSLHYLQRFHFNKIKIDRSFVAEVDKRSDCAAIVSAVTGLAKGLNAVTTAEGVETPEQFRLLHLAGCDEVQGYLFGRPRPAAALEFQRTAARRRRTA